MDLSKYHGCTGVHMKAKLNSPAMIIINRITFGAITELQECSVLEDLHHS